LQIGYKVSCYFCGMNRSIVYILTLILWQAVGMMEIKAQNIVVDDTNNRQLAGDPIFQHQVGYAGMVEYEGEEIPWFILSDVYIYNKLKFKTKRQAKKYFKIAYNIKKVYPIAVEIQKTINSCVSHLDSLQSKEEKDAYMKNIEKELRKQYTPKLKKLTFAQGKLLIKLIDRQCGMTSYQLIRTYMGKFKAGLSNAFASLFGASLKKQYDPDVDDRLTERCILLIESGQM
jgi:hypothetical protein